MTWNELLTTELRRLHAQEAKAVATFQAMEAQASGTLTRTLLRETIDDAPSRLTRLELILAPLDPLDVPTRGRSLRSFDGWRVDVADLGRGDSLGEAHDAALLGLLLRIMRMRTSCYEVAHVLASNLDRRVVAKLLSALLSADLAMDARAAETLARVVGEGEGRWDLRELKA